jgi:hypothetical protein
MTGTTISSDIGSTVTLGSPNYQNPLTILAPNEIAPSAYGATGLYGPAAAGAVTVTNDGRIVGGGGGTSGPGVGGAGADFLASATLINSGTISGGAAGPYGAPAATGGVGVNLAAGGGVSNQGTILGGTGGDYGNGGNLVAGHGGAGGNGIDIAGGTLSNAAAIYGGSGGTGGSSLGGGFGGNGGYGVDLSGGTMVNSGTITGGAGGFNGGDYAGAGVAVGTGAVAINNATIVGGQGGNGGFNRYGDGFVGGQGGAGAMLTGGTLVDNGVITGGNGGVIGNGAGKAGVIIEGGTLVVFGTVSGGDSGTGGGQADAVRFQGGVDGVLLVNPGAVFNGLVDGYGLGTLELGAGLAASTLVGLGTEFVGLNEINIVSGANWVLTGPFTGGLGDLAVAVASGSTLAASGGAIVGGGGRYGAAGRPGGTGGAGIILAAGDTLINQDTVIGGSGGLANASSIGGGGGVGVVIASNDSVTNDGTIIGGAGGYDNTTSNGGTGGGAVVIAGGSLTNSGSIEGGAGGSQLDDTSLSGQAGTEAKGGIGVDLTAGASITNDGTVTGGFLGAGVYLNASSLINNRVISGGYRAYGTELVNGATATNNATIAGGSGLGNGLVNNAFPGPAGDGVVLTSGAALTNQGTIIAGFGGAGAALSASMLLNNLLIEGGGYGDGATLAAGSSLTNDGTIIGGSGPYTQILSTSSGRLGSEAIGAGVALTASTATNNGTIVGGSGSDGAYLGAGGTLTNTGSITSAYGYGIHLTNGAFAVNAGTIAGVRDGGAYLNGGTFINTAVVASGRYSPGVFLNGGTVITSGTIDGRNSFTIVEPPFQGPLKFYPGGTYTVPSFAAVQFGSHAAKLVVDPGAVFIDGISATPTVSDTLELAAGPFTGTLTGFGSSITGFGTIAFDQGADWFIGGSTAGLTGTISGFARGDTIQLDGIAVTGSSYANGVLTLTEATGPATLDLPGSFSTTDFVVTNTAGGADVTLAPICYLPGTLIATPEGEIEVERLAAGDRVLTLSGAVRPIVWVGTGRVLATRGRRSAATPVIVRKGALGDNVPHADLRVTKAHALYIDGILVPVEFLVNHRTILWDDHAQEVTIYHVELETHDVLVANGAPAESYRDDGNRWLFQNASDGWSLPPQDPCAPVMTGGAAVDALWLRLLERAGPRRGGPLTDDPDLHLVLDGRRLDAAERVGDVHVFRIPALPSALRIVSRAAVPAEHGVARDPRMLGVALRRLVIRKGTRFQVIAAADDRLRDGFHAFEAETGLRWTDGDTPVHGGVFDGFAGSFELVLHVGATTRYPADGDALRVA